MTFIRQKIQTEW